MAKYMFSHYVTEAWTASFDADSLEHAEELLEQANNGDINLSELPNYQEKNKGLDLEVDLNSLEEYR